MSKTFVIDTSRCTACRGCQVACKEWHGLPANETKQRGTHQNPADLNPYTYKLVRFSEHKEDGRVVWNFFPDQCRHCIDPPCKFVADTYVKDAIIKDEATGAVLYTDRTRYLDSYAVQEVVNSCPYNIPRLNTGTGILTKCDMCYGRIRNNMLPACVKACPTGAMNFGDRKDMLDFAQARLSKVKKDHPQARMIDADSTNVIYIITDKPNNYWKYAVASASAYNPQSRLGKLIAERVSKRSKRIA
jgi:formate dehydrogenase iron-sulfur subunit